MFDSVLNKPLELLPIFAKDSILMFNWVLDMLLTYLKNNKNQKTCKVVIFRNAVERKE